MWSVFSHNNWLKIFTFGLYKKYVTFLHSFIFIWTFQLEMNNNPIGGKKKKKKKLNWYWHFFLSTNIETKFVNACSHINIHISMLNQTKNMYVWREIQPGSDISWYNLYNYGCISINKGIDLDYNWLTFFWFRTQ